MRVSEEVMAVLSASRTQANALFITAGQLDRKLYEATNRVLEAAGGKWNRKTKAHLFAGDAADAMDQVLVSGEITRPQDFGYFPTPAAVVDRLLDLAAVRVADRVLEPSAGTGAIAIPLSRFVDTLDCVELLAKNVEVLRAALPHATIVEGDFLALSPPPLIEYDCVVMNPPFAKQADIKHVLHAAKFLRPGGTLVSVMSAGVRFRQDRTAVAFRKFLADRGGAVENLPPDSFKESGTTVNAVVVRFSTDAEPKP